MTNPSPNIRVSDLTPQLRPPARPHTLNWSLTNFTLPAVYPILDTATLDRLDLPCLTAAEALIEGGAQILQLRHKTFWSRETFLLARKIAEFCNSAGILFVVNDRADYAALLGAALHVGQDDLTPADARKVVGAAAILGYSTHNPDQVKESAYPSPQAAQSLTAAPNITEPPAIDLQNRDCQGAALHPTQSHQPVDQPANHPAITYLAFGPVFPTVSKHRPDPTVGIAGLKAVRALTQKPLVAIGGITRDNAFTCWNAGADSVAIIADLYPDPCTKTTLRDRMTEWRQLKKS